MEPRPSRPEDFQHRIQSRQRQSSCYCAAGVDTRHIWLGLPITSKHLALGQFVVLDAGGLAGDGAYDASASSSSISAGRYRVGTLFGAKFPHRVRCHLT
jgi:hypothetical protein